MIAEPSSPFDCVLGKDTTQNVAGSLAHIPHDGATEMVKEWDLPSKNSKPKSKDRICCLLFLSPTRCFRPLVHVQLVYFAR